MEMAYWFLNTNPGCRNEIFKSKSKRTGAQVLDSRLVHFVLFTDSFVISIK